ncbi:hypothetical protein [Parasitella parasitica]|uniref:RRM domain-containing protein n=1 Tax=Parasitella parasitica TaxID=35722 RepID=A0A0B7ND06_9FUNG|nr:hypothetical protein [Parasitella parasitica]
MSVVPYKPTGNYYIENNHGQKKDNPAACVFVASLDRNIKDVDLKTSVYEHFMKWGHIQSVKVFKDWLKRPYAFVQYESVNDCKQALKEAQNTSINGRRIRCEPAKHVANVLSEYGEIESMNILQPHGKFHSIIIKFKYRDDAITAYMDLKFPKNNVLSERSYQQWFVEWAAYLDGDNVYGVCGTSCRLDKHTVFVGNLPEAINEEDLFIRFTRYGHILDIHLIRKPVNRYAAKKVFAFIKYQGEKETAEAIDAENGALLQERIIRVCYRQYPCPVEYNNQCNYQCDPLKSYKTNAPPVIGNFANSNSNSMPYFGYSSSSSSSNNNRNSNGFGYNSNVYHTPPSNGYYVDPYPTMVYYTYPPYTNPYNNNNNNIHPTLVNNVGTNKHDGSDNNATASAAAPY